MDPIEEKAGENKKDINEELRSAISNELSSYMNPKIGKTPEETMQNTPEKAVEETISSLTEPKITESAPKQVRPIIRTYKSDVEETIQTGHISSVNIAIAQNQRMMRNVQESGLEEPKKSKLNKSILIISIILILGGALAIFIPYFLVQNKYSSTPVKPETVKPSAIITTDLQEKINLNDINLNRVATTLKERVDQSATSLGQMKNIYLTEGDGVNEQLITSTKFLSLIKANLPPEITRTLLPQYMFGMYNYNGNQRFLILKVGAYDTTFSGMLSWEVNLWQDFKELFSLRSDESTSSTSSLGIEIKKFQDDEFVNKNVREVKDSSGKIVFLYSILDNNTVAITTSVDTLKEIVSRLTKSKVITQ